MVTAATPLGARLMNTIVTGAYTVRYPTRLNAVRKDRAVDENRSDRTTSPASLAPHAARTAHERAVGTIGKDVSSSHTARSSLIGHLYRGVRCSEAADPDDGKTPGSIFVARTRHGAGGRRSQSS